MKTKFFYCFYDYLLFKIILNANYWEFKSIFFIVMLLIQFFLRFQLMQEELLGLRTYFPGFFFCIQTRSHRCSEKFKRRQPGLYFVAKKMIPYRDHVQSPIGSCTLLLAN